jgi:hypothetical protein
MRDIQGPQIQEEATSQNISEKRRASNTRQSKIAERQERCESN